MSYQQAMQTGDYESAIAQLDQRLQTDPAQPKLWYAKAVALLSLHQAEAATIAIDQALRLQPEMAIAHRLLGKARRLSNDIPGAILAYKQATRLYIALQDKANAETCLAEIDQLKPAAKPAEPLISSKGFLENAIAAIQKGHYRQALQDLNWLLQLDPNNIEALIQRSFVHAHTHSPNGAIADILKATQLEADNPALRLKRGELYLLLGHIENAIADFSALLASNPVNVAQLHYLRGQALQQIHNLEQAEKDISQALKKQPSNPDYLRARGEISEERGYLQEALEDYRQAQVHYLNQGNLNAHQQLQYTIHTLDTQLRTFQQQQKQIIRIPIKRFSSGTPIVEVLFNDSCRFDMVLDTGASMTFLTQRMGSLLNITPIHMGRFGMADGRIIQEPIGIVNSVALDRARVEHLKVGISSTSREGLLGQNFFGRYDMHILRNTIELHPRR